MGNSNECSHNCSSCKENCESRIEKFPLNPDSKIKHIIGILSGKGGVGKSFITSSVAANLAKQGFRVGILDADITGPSIPKAFGLKGFAEGDGVKYIYPKESKTGVKIISSNFLLENEDEPIIWRSSLITSLLSQFFQDTLWGELDFLLIDLPPGTADVTLTSFQQIPLEGIIFVSTPQELVKMIVKKSVHMAKLMNIEIIGIIENMSYINCPCCNEKIYPFGKSNIEEIAATEGVKVLGQVELNEKKTKEVDEGHVENIESEDIDKIVSNILKEVLKDNE